MARTDYYGIQTPVLQATSQAIRTVNGTVGTIAPEDYPDLISAMKSGTDYDNVMAQLVEETTTPAAIASITDGADDVPTKQVICSINPTETGTGAKSPSNPYVIGGHTGINVYQRGANLWDEQWEVGSIDPANGQPTTATNVIRSKNYIPVNANSTYYCTNANVYAFYQFDVNKNYIGEKLNTNTNTFASGTAFVKFRTKAVYGTTYNNDISINYPSTDTTYHAYNGRTNHAAFGQTVYGGTLNVTTGVLTIDRQLVTLNGSEEYTVNQPYIKSDACDALVYNSNIFPRVSPQGQPDDLLCDKLQFSKVGTWGSTGHANQFCINTTQIHINIANDLLGITDYTQETTSTVKAKIKTWVTNNPLTLTIPVSPTTIQLDPIEVRTLLGANNLYHDCNGDTEVTYRANGALYVAQH